MFHVTSLQRALWTIFTVSSSIRSSIIISFYQFGFFFFITSFTAVCSVRSTVFRDTLIIGFKVLCPKFEVEMVWYLVHYVT